MVRWRAAQFRLITALPALLAGFSSVRASDTNLEDQVRSLREQNTALQQQVQKQGDQLNDLTQKVKELQTTGPEHDNSIAANSAAPKTGSSYFNQVSISGEGGVSFFKTGPEGFAPNSEFRVDEARLFIESPIWKEVYFYGEVDLATRESTDLNVELGELYLDFQDVGQEQSIELSRRPDGHSVWRGISVPQRDR
jgi:hypothetical protein